VFNGDCLPKMKTPSVARIHRCRYSNRCANLRRRTADLHRI